MAERDDSLGEYKVSRLIDKYGLDGIEADLVEHWTVEGADRLSLRELADYFNKQILDSLEAIDSDRIAALVEYLTDYCDYLFVALLPEDAEPLTGHNTIENI